jgi:hypothetical protein
MTIVWASAIFAAVQAAFSQPGAAPPPRTQNPSPMVEYTRAHPRLKQESPPGQRLTLRVGTLFLPERLPKDAAPLLVHQHGAPWIAELAAARAGVACVTLQLGAGSATYARPFADPAAFTALLAEAQTKAGRRLGPIALSGWSAGYGGIRAILQAPEHYARVDAVLLLDGLHAGYVGGQPGPRDSKLIEEDLAIFVALARDAAAGRKELLFMHTEIFPGTFASTTETADYLLKALALRRQPVLRWGPMGTQVLGELQQGDFHLISIAGNSAPDHIDVLHAMPELLGQMRWPSAGRSK